MHNAKQHDTPLTGAQIDRPLPRALHHPHETLPPLRSTRCGGRRSPAWNWGPDMGWSDLAIKQTIGKRQVRVGTKSKKSGDCVQRIGVKYWVIGFPRGFRWFCRRRAHGNGGRLKGIAITNGILQPYLLYLYVYTYIQIHNIYKDI